MMYETILSPINYGGLQLKNRIIFAPTTFGLSDEEYLAKIRAIAQGGCAMIIVGDVPVGKSKFEKSLFDTKGFAFYQQVVKIAHDADCKVCAQLHQSDSNLLAMFKYIPGLLLKKITPDQLREKLNAEVAPYITNMSQRNIHEIISGFGKAAALAKQAGFDMVQVHGDRMCGSFSSAIFNHRTDEYGGSAENRARFAAEAVSAVHAAVPGMPIDYKLAVRQENPHFGNAGVVEEELPVFVPLLEQAGVTSFRQYRRICAFSARSISRPRPYPQQTMPPAASSTARMAAPVQLPTVSKVTLSPTPAAPISSAAPVR